jgi:hypothetical protein
MQIDKGVVGQPKQGRLNPAKLVLAGAAVSLLVLSLVTQAPGVSQWCRKYNSDCTLCHTGFPRLTYYGEKFMRNGFQLEGSQDGDEEGKKQVDQRLWIDQIENFFGIRLSFTPLQVKTNAITVDGDKKTSVDIGQTDWVQLFTAGTIFKNTSIFIETELQTESQKVKNNWFTLGFHNLLGTQGVANLRLGQISALEWHSTSGRLRMIPNVKVDAVEFKPSAGKGEDSPTLAAGMPGVEFYGYKGPVVYSAGVVNGGSFTDKNVDKNVFGTLRLEKTAGNLEGSAITFWGMRGVDTDSTASATTIQQRNIYWRLSPGFNLRHKGLDIAASFFYGEDDNWTLVNTGKVNNIFRAASVQVGYIFTPAWYAVLQYDKVETENSKTLESHKLTPSVWFFPRSNMRLGLTGRIDLQEEEPIIHPDKLHEFIITIRTML